VSTFASVTAGRIASPARWCHHGAASHAISAGTGTDQHGGGRRDLAAGKRSDSAGDGGSAILPATATAPDHIAGDGALLTLLPRNRTIRNRAGAAGDAIRPSVARRHPTGDGRRDLYESRLQQINRDPSVRCVAWIIDTVDLQLLSPI